MSTKVTSSTKSQEDMKVRMVDALSALDNKIVGHNDIMGVYTFDIYSNGDNEQVSMVPLTRVRTEGGENYLRFSYVSMQVKHLMGEVLTALEASIADERQLKATKSIVKNYFSSKLSWIYEVCGLPEDEQDSLMNPDEKI